VTVVENLARPRLVAEGYRLETTALGLSLDAPSALLDPTDRIDTFTPIAGAPVAPGSEITIVASVPAGMSLTGCSP